MTLPVIIASTREALSSVPVSFREPAGMSVLQGGRQSGHRSTQFDQRNFNRGDLQVSRAAGETAPIMFTGAVFYKAVKRGELFPYELPINACSFHALYTVTTQVPNIKESFRMQQRLFSWVLYFW